ncbi:MAG: glycogen synthase, partial [Lachnospiraceae bacterium]|nr:glycogen synthase [Lachnospiraceae bacterium]
MFNDKIKVLYAAAEASPFCKTGGLGDVAGSFPRALVSEHIDERVIMPLYSSIDTKYRKNMEKVVDFTVPLSWRNEYCGVYKLVHNGVMFYFLDNEYYFKRDGLYGFFDDGERMAFYAKALLETIMHIDFKPQILHANDWHAALSIVYLREMYNHLPEYKDIKTIFTIHNIKFQGMYNAFVLDDITGLSTHPDAKRQLMQGDSVNFMRGACNYADIITTVSPTYAKEISTPEGGEGLDGLVRANSEKLFGILNGIDTEINNPKTDPSIEYKFDINDFTAVKAKNKEALQRELGLPVDSNVFMIGIVSRLTDQKG